MDISQIRFASRYDGISGSAIREIFKMLAVPGMISFAGGNPSPASFPEQELAEIAKDQLLKKPARLCCSTVLQKGTDRCWNP